jgi:hypothetical protein
MSSASDISNLFQMLGASPSHYQEVEKTEQMHGSRGRWSMPTMPAPADFVRDDGAASDAEDLAASVPADAAEMASNEPPQPAVSAEEATEGANEASPEPAAESTSSAQSQAAAEQPVPQSAPEPVIAAEQPGSLSAMFARLREQSRAQEDVAQRHTS